MSIESTLTEIAAQLKERSEARAAALQHELQELEARKAVIQADLELADNARDRLKRYRPKTGGEDICPYCWMKHERQPALYAIGGGTPHEDHFRCSECRQQIAVEF
jgi:hypothetical protein